MCEVQVGKYNFDHKFPKTLQLDKSLNFFEALAFFDSSIVRLAKLRLLKADS